MAEPRNRDELRGAVYRADVEMLIGMITDLRWPDDALQLLGDAVVIRARERGHDIQAAARRCVRELQERDWEGDAELAAEIQSVLGWSPTPLLRSLPVDLEDLGCMLEGDPLMGGGAIDLKSGEVWPQSVLENFEEISDDDLDLDDDERWLLVDSDGSRSGYRDMELFIDNLPDEHLADLLARSIRGRGAFRRFKDTLADSPDQLERWHAFSDDRHRGRARAWLAAHGYTPVNSRPEF